MSPASRLRRLLKGMIPQSARNGLRRMLDVANTEYHFRFRRGAVRAQLEALRPIPRGLHIEGTNICNAECVFCAYPQMERRKKVMPMEDFRRVVDEYVAMGGRSVSLTPIVGDPFVDKFFFERLEDLYARPEITQIGFYTNAILMDREKSERLMAYADKLHVHVSWGGFDATTWNRIMGVKKFEAARDAVLAFLEIKQRSGSPIPFTLALRCPDSACQGPLWDQLNAARKQGLVEIAGMPDYDSWAGKIEADALTDVGLTPRTMPYKRGACELLFTKPVVLADGRVNACACRDVEAELIVGDVHDEPLSKIWAGSAITDLIERHEKGDYPDVCKRCTYFVSVYNSRKSRTFDAQGNPTGNWSE
ncbi:MAG: radical SAM protein [Planctomycetes bacterium]|nr:radical SAM protein [Planctomycetota bacterium]